MDKDDIARWGQAALIIGVGAALAVDGLDYISEADAAVVANSFITGQLPRAPIASLTSVGTTAVTFFTAGTAGSELLGMSCSSTDSAGQSLILNRVRSATTYILATETIAANSGNAAGTLPVNMLAPAAIALPINSDQNPYLFIESGDTLTIASAGTITSGKTIACSGVGFDF